MKKIKTSVQTKNFVQKVRGKIFEGVWQFCGIEQEENTCHIKLNVIYKKKQANITKLSQ